MERVGLNHRPILSVISFRWCEGFFSSWRGKEKNTRIFWVRDKGKEGNTAQAERESGKARVKEKLRVRLLLINANTIAFIPTNVCCNTDFFSSLTTLLPSSYRLSRKKFSMHNNNTAIQQKEKKRKKKDHNMIFLIWYFLFLSLVYFENSNNDIKP